MCSISGRHKRDRTWLVMEEQLGRPCWSSLHNVQIYFLFASSDDLNAINLEWRMSSINRYLRSASHMAVPKITHTGTRSLSSPMRTDILWYWPYCVYSKPSRLWTSLEQVGMWVDGFCVLYCTQSNYQHGHNYSCSSSCRAQEAEGPLKFNVVSVCHLALYVGSPWCSRSDIWHCNPSLGYCSDKLVMLLLALLQCRTSVTSMGPSLLL